MKYLLGATLSILSFVAVTQASEPSFEIDDVVFESGLAFNEDVSRKFTLDAPGVVESQIDIRFRVGSQSETRAYYHVIEAGLAEHNLVSLTAVVATSQNEAKIERVAVSKLPANL